ncbi:MAG: patatin-like phospholipase family protein [Limisphaerales bacterium]
MPTKIQLALQGGGAKLVSLLAALEAVAASEQSGEIQVTRIAGTSAGAIAGSLFAALPKAERLQRFRTLRNQLLGQRGKKIATRLIMPGSPALAWSGYRGNQVWAEGKEEIRKWLIETLGGKTFEDILQKGQDNIVRGIALDIVSADLSSKSKKTYKPDDAVLTAVMESCALPFLFASWHQGETVIVDGGFCENLPVSELNLNVPTDGVVVAVSFERLPPESPKCIKTFSLALLDIAIAHSVRRAYDAVKANGHYIIELEPKIGTFDFEQAFNDAYRNTYEGLVEVAKKRISEIVAEEQMADAKIKSQEIQSNYWTDSNKNLIDTMRRMGLVYERIFRSKRFRYEKVIFEVWVDAWKNPALPCKLRLRSVFNPSGSEIECTSIQLSEFDPTIDAITSLKVSDAGHNDVRMICVPMRIEKTPKNRSVVAFFERPLKSEDGPFTQTYVDKLHLTENQLQDFIFTADRPDGAIGIVELVLHVPLNKKGVDLVQKDDMVGGRKMTPAELSQHDNDPAEYYVVGWTGANMLLQPDEKFGANIFVPA